MHDSNNINVHVTTTTRMGFLARLKRDPPHFSDTLSQIQSVPDRVIVPRASRIRHAARVSERDAIAADDSRRYAAVL